jgi:hypothetical protein
MTVGEEKDRRTEPEDPAIACSLEADAVPARREAWQRLLERAESCTAASDGSLRAEFGTDVDLVEIAPLVAAEQRCCAFFSFGLSVDANGLVLEVRVPAGAADIATALFNPVQ